MRGTEVEEGRFEGGGHGPEKPGEYLIHPEGGRIGFSVAKPNSEVIPIVDCGGVKGTSNGFAPGVVANTVRGVPRPQTKGVQNRISG